MIPWRSFPAPCPQFPVPSPVPSLMPCPQFPVPVPCLPIPRFLPQLPVPSSQFPVPVPCPQFPQFPQFPVSSFLFEFPVLSSLSSVCCPRPSSLSQFSQVPCLQFPVPSPLSTVPFFCTSRGAMCKELLYRLHTNRKKRTPKPPTTKQNQATKPTPQRRQGEEQPVMQLAWPRRHGEER